MKNKTAKTTTRREELTTALFNICGERDADELNPRELTRFNYILETLKTL